MSTLDAPYRLIEEDQLPVLLSIKGLSKSFRPAQPLRLSKGAPRAILTSVTFDVQPGDILVLRGANGSGKSTLLKLLCGLVVPDGGHFRFDPRSTVSSGEALASSHEAPCRSQIGYSSGEERSLHWRLSAVDNLAFTGSLYGLSRTVIAQRTASLFAALGLEQCSSARVGTLSSGQRQRVLVARAVLAKPRLVLLDEPTGSMDEQGIQMFWNLIHRLAAQGAAAIISSHRESDEDHSTAVARLLNGEVKLTQNKSAVRPFEAGQSDLRQSDGSVWRDHGDPRTSPSRGLVIWRRALAFVSRDFKVARSYPMGLISSAVLPIFSAVMLFFLARVVGRGSSYLHQYGSNYFAFALLGEVAFILQLMLLQSFASTIRDGQVTGTLESILVTGTRIQSLIMYSAIWNAIIAFLQICALVAFPMIFLGLALGGNFSVLALAIVLLIPLSCLGLGLMEGAFVLVAKRGSPLNMVVGLGTQLFGGVLYPLAVLPIPLRLVANALPIAHGAQALRDVLLLSDPRAFLVQVAFLVGLSVLYGLLGYVSISRAFALARRAGSLSQY